MDILDAVILGSSQLHISLRQVAWLPNGMVPFRPFMISAASVSKESTASSTCPPLKPVEAKRDKSNRDRLDKRNGL